MNIFQFTAVDKHGNIKSGAYVKVTDAETGALATIYEDIDGLTPKDNPFTADAEGYAFFYAGVGRYDVTAYTAGYSRTWSDITVGEATSAFTGDSGAGGSEGLVPAPAAGDNAAGKFLKASGGWAVPPGVTPDVFTGDSGAGGVAGLVPAPAAGDAAANKFLKASGGWATVSVASLILGQCRLVYVSATQIRLDRYKGSYLFINGTAQTVPSAGVTLANTGLSASTKYYIYAYMNSGTMTLEASTSAPTADSTYGHQIKGVAGGESRTLVGRVIMNSSGQFFFDVTVAMGVVSWFNPRQIIRYEQALVGPVPQTGISVPGTSNAYAFMTATTSNTLAAGQFVGTGRILFARWRSIWGTTNVGNRVQLVHFDDGPTNITEISSFTSNGSGNPVNDAALVTSTLQALQEGTVAKNLGIRVSVVNGTTYIIYKQAIEFVVEVDPW